jgi:hypothetical protein
MWINNKNWNMRLVRCGSPILRRSDGVCVMGVCDRDNRTIYIADSLSDEMFRKVSIHEICHAYMSEYGINLTVEQEEIVCQIMCEYGTSIIETADNVFYRLKRGVS